MDVGSKDVLTPQVVEHYRNVLPTLDARSTCGPAWGYRRRYGLAGLHLG